MYYLEYNVYDCSFKISKTKFKENWLNRYYESENIDDIIKHLVNESENEIDNLYKEEGKIKIRRKRLENFKYIIPRKTKEEIKNAEIN